MIEFTSFEYLDELIAAGWGSVPQTHIPANWRDIPADQIPKYDCEVRGVPDIPRVRGKVRGKWRDPAARRADHEQWMRRRLG